MSEESEESTRTTPRRGTGLPWWGKLLAVLVALVVLFTLLIRFAVIPGLGELFGEETHDRTGPALLKSIKDMSRYEAATGNFQVVVDLEKDTKYLPDALKGKRTLYVGAGTVSSYVELGGLKDDDVRVNDDRTEATLRLPRAVLGKPALDPDRSYAVSKQRGLLDRLGDFFSDNPNDERAVQKLAAEHIGDAAKDSELTARAEKNTTSMLEGLLHSLGFDTVRVTYAAKK
ncbi:secreted protein [Streptomyces sp. SPB074]|nr:secreted protein [Streptomyces sp. SPB074]